MCLLRLSNINLFVNNKKNIGVIIKSKLLNLSEFD